MYQKGNVLLTILFIIVAIAGIGLGWFYVRDQDAFGGLNLELPFLNSNPSFSTAGWKQFPADNGKIIVLYPPDWLTTDDRYITQYPYTPGRFSSDVYNAISIHPVLNQVQTSYANQDWFAELYNAKDGAAVVNQYHVNDQYKPVKIASLKTFRGNKIVIFNEQDPNLNQAYLLVDSTRLYQFSIQNFDQTGMDYFEKIIQTATVP